MLALYCKRHVLRAVMPNSELVQSRICIHGVITQSITNEVWLMAIVYETHTHRK